MTSAIKRLALNAPYCPCQAKAITVAKIIETAAANQILSKSVSLDSNEAFFCDLGIDNFATFVSTKPGVRPFLIKGKVLKILNQNYNKQVAELRSKGHRAHIRAKGVKRYWRLHDLLHKASRLVINHCLAYDVGHIVIGVNQEWKQEVNLGKRNNQNFVMLPHENLWR